MSKEAPVSIARVLAAKEDLLLVEKTNSERVRRHTQSSVNKVVIGKVHIMKKNYFSLLYYKE